VRDARVVQKLGLGLDRAATDAVVQWRFTPARYEGRPVKVLYVLTVAFELS
jgi:outer membrane biosynthesis protein TonB